VWFVIGWTVSIALKSCAFVHCYCYWLVAQKFATNETGSLLWHLFSHAPFDAAKVTALSVSSNISFLPLSCIYTVYGKKVPLYFASDFAKCVLIFKILSPTDSPFFQIDVIGATTIVWRVRGKIIRCVLCSIVCISCAQCSAHIWTDLAVVC